LGIPRKKIGGPKTEKFRRNFGQLRDLIGPRSRQSESAATLYEHSLTWQLNLMVNFGPQTEKNRTVDWINLKSRFSDAHILGLRGSAASKFQNGKARLTLVDAYLVGMGLYPTIFSN